MSRGKITVTVPSYPLSKEQSPYWQEAVYTRVGPPFQSLTLRCALSFFFPAQLPSLCQWKVGRAWGRCQGHTGNPQESCLVTVSCLFIQSFHCDSSARKQHSDAIFLSPSQMRQWHSCLTVQTSTRRLGKLGCIKRPGVMEIGNEAEQGKPVVMQLTVRHRDPFPGSGAVCSCVRWLPSG